MVKRLTNRKFWKAAFIRAFYTFCEVVSVGIGTATLIEAVNWRYVLSTSVLASLLSLLKSILIGVPEVEYEDVEEE